MTAGLRERLILPDGKAMVLSVGVADDFGGVILNRDNSPRDTATDTITVSAKEGTTTRTLTVAFDTPSTDGGYTVNIPSAQLVAAAELFVDIYNQKSGGAKQIIKRLQFTIEDSDAD